MDLNNLEIKDYIKIVHKRKFTIIIFFIIVSLITVIVTFRMVPIYEASTKVLIEKKETNPLNNPFIRVDREFQQTQYEIIKSTNVAKTVVKMLSLDKDLNNKEEPPPPSLIDKLKTLLSGLFSTSMTSTDSANNQTDDPSIEVDSDEDSTNNAIEGIASFLSRNLVIKPIRGTKIIVLSYSSDNPVFATDVVNTFVEAYMEEALEINMSYSAKKMKWMTKKADEELSKVEASEKALQQYMREQDVVALENQMSVMPQKLQGINTQLSQIETRRYELGEILNKVRQLGSNYDAIELLPGIVDKEVLQEIRTQVQISNQQINDLSKKYGKKHPFMIKATNDRETLSRKKRQEIKRIIFAHQNSYDLDLANERNLRSSINRTRAEIQQLNEKFIQYSIIKRDLETNHIFYQSLIDEIKKQNLSNESEAINVWVMEPALVPAYPVKPNKKKYIMLGLMLGLMGGIVLAFLIEFLDNTVKSIDELEYKFDIKVLGAIPQYENNSDETPVEMIVKREPLSQIAESYKAIRTSLLLASANQPPKKILISSMSPQEGKSTSTSNMAIALAESGYNVMIIDCDLRRPRIHKIYKLENQNGLSSYLAGISDLDEIVQTDTQFPNMAFIPSGPIPPNPSELLSSKSFRNLISELEEPFNFILLDGPPVLSITDSVLLTDIADGLLVVCKAGSTTYDSIKRGLKVLNDVKAAIIGVLINSVEKKHSESYYYGYQDYYTQEDDEDELKL